MNLNEIFEYGQWKRELLLLKYEIGNKNRELKNNGESIRIGRTKASLSSLMD